MTSGSTVGELAVSQSHRPPQQTHARGGQPYHSLARSPAAWRSIKRRWPSPLLRKSTTLRVSPSALSARAKARSTSASGQCHPKATLSSWSRKRAPAGTGAIVADPTRPGPLGGGPAPGPCPLSAVGFLRVIIARGKNPQQVVGTMARELRALRWALAPQGPRTPERRRSWCP